MDARLEAVMRDAIECRCRPNIDDIDAQNIMFEIERLRNSVDTYMVIEAQHVVELTKIRAELKKADDELNEFAECIAVNKVLERRVAELREAKMKMKLEEVAQGVACFKPTKAVWNEAIEAAIEVCRTTGIKHPQQTGQEACEGAIRELMK